MRFSLRFQEICFAPVVAVADRLFCLFGHLFVWSLGVALVAFESLCQRKSEQLTCAHGRVATALTTTSKQPNKTRLPEPVGHDLKLPLPLQTH